MWRDFSESYDFTTTHYFRTAAKALFHRFGARALDYARSARHTLEEKGEAEAAAMWQEIYSVLIALDAAAALNMSDHQQ